MENSTFEKISQDIDARMHEIPEFKKVAETGDIQLCNEFIASTSNINQKTILKEKTVLHFSVEKGYEEICRLLLENGCNINSKCCGISFIRNHKYIKESGVTPLMLAAFYGYENICRLLISRKADINSSTKDFNLTALTIAAEKGYEGICRLLIGHGANVNNISSNRTNGNPFFYFTMQTPLTISIKRGHIDVAKLLNSHGCKLDPGALSGEKTPLFYAAESGLFDLCQVLINAGANVNPIPVKFDGETPLSISAKKGYKEICKLLLDSKTKFKPNENWKTSSPPLYNAAEIGDKEICRMLIEAGFDVNERYPYLGETPLHIACANGYKDVCKLLIENGAELERTKVCKDEEYSAFWIAASSGYVEICEILKNAGAKVDKLDSEERSPLYVAAKWNSLDVCKFLFESCKLDVNQAKDNGRTPLSVALKEGHKKVAKFLESVGGRQGKVTKKKRAVLKRFKVERE